MGEGNPNHDAQGRFASGDGSGSGAPKTPHSKPPTWRDGDIMHEGVEELTDEDKAILEAMKPTTRKQRLLAAMDKIKNGGE